MSFTKTLIVPSVGRMDVFMNSCELVSLVTAVSCAIAKCTPEEDLPVIAAVLSQIAATLATIAVQEKAKEPAKQIPEVPVDILPDTAPDSGIISDFSI